MKQKNNIQSQFETTLPLSEDYYNLLADQEPEIREDISEFEMEIWYPKGNNAYDLGSPEFNFNNIYSTGTSYLGNIIFNGNIIPTKDSQFDIGTPELKVREIYISENSLWIGDKHRITISNDEIQFKKRKVNIVPQTILDLGGTEEDALVFLEKTNLNNILLNDWVLYGQELKNRQNIPNSESEVSVSEEPELTINDIFNENEENYDQVNAIRWIDNENGGITSDLPITIGEITIPNTDGLNNQLLVTDGDGNLNWKSLNSGIFNLDSIPINKGGTSSTNINDAQKNLGLEIGVDIQKFNSNLDNITNSGSGVIISNEEREILNNLNNVVNQSTPENINNTLIKRDSEGNIKINNLQAVKITNLNLPINQKDAVNKEYVDNIAKGLDVKESVRLASTDNIDISLNFLNILIDSKIPNSQDRILLKDQNDKKENGIYIIQENGNIIRSIDMNSNSSASSSFMFVEEGEINKDKGFVCISDKDQDIVSINDLNFSQFSKLNNIIAGIGISRIGDVLNINSSQTQIKKIGIVDTGTWNADPIDDAYISSSQTWNNKQDSLTFGIQDTNSIVVDSDSVAENDLAVFTTSGVAGKSISELKIDLDLNNVENIAVSTWNGSENITSVGTINNGTWNADPIDDAYISSSQTWNNKQDSLTFGIQDTNSIVVDSDSVAENDLAVFTTSGIAGKSISELKIDLDLNNVENIAVSTWNGSENITSVGIVDTGTWNADPIDDAYISSSQTWNNKQDSLTFGIQDTNSIVVDSDSVAENDLAVFTTSGVAGKSISELKIDLDLNNVENIAVSTWNGSENITSVGIVDIGTWNANPIDDAYISSSQTWNNKQNSLTFGIQDTNSIVVDSDSVAENDLAVFTTSGVAGKSIGQLKIDLDLNNVENIAVSTWNGSENITSVGIVNIGTWNANPIDDAYISSSQTWNNKQNSLTFGIQDTNSIVVDSDSVAENDLAVFTTSGVAGKSISELKIDLDLNNVENIAVSTWNGSENITSVGIVNIGTWNANPIDDAYISSSQTWNNKQNSLTFGIQDTNSIVVDSDSVAENDLAVFTTSGVAGKSISQLKIDLDLNNVENIAVSTWNGSENITSVGIVNIGTWNASPIDDAYISSSQTWNNKQDSLTFGIQDTNSIVVDSDSVAENDLAVFTTSGVAGKSISELKINLDLNNVENIAVSTWNGSENITSVGIVNIGTWNASPIDDAYISSSQTWNNKQDSLTFGIQDTNSIVVDSNSVAENDLAVFTTSGVAGKSIGQLKIDLDLNNVENIAVSTWNGSENITSVGIVNIAHTNVSPIDDAYISSSQTWNNKQDSLTFGIQDTNSIVVDSNSVAENDLAVFTTSGVAGKSIGQLKIDLDLNNVENIAVSTWNGSENITSVGTINNGTWNASPIDDAYIYSSQTWNNKQDSLTFGIQDTNSIVVDSDSIAENDLAVFTTSGVAGKSIGELKIDLDLVESLNDLSDVTIHNDDLNIFIGSIPSNYDNNHASSHGGNVGLGFEAFDSITYGYRNTCIGYRVGTSITTGNSNTILGSGQTGMNITTGSRNVIIGQGSCSSGTNAMKLYVLVINLILASSSSGAANQIVIGADAKGIKNDSITLGNDNITDVYLGGGELATNLLVEPNTLLPSITTNVTDANNGTLSGLSTQTNGNGSNAVLTQVFQEIL